MPPRIQPHALQRFHCGERYEGCRHQLEPILSDAGCSTMLMQRPGQIRPGCGTSRRGPSVCTSKLAASRRWPTGTVFIARRYVAPFGQVVTTLKESQMPTHQSAGAWLELLIDTMSATGTGYARNAADKMHITYPNDSELLGQFRVSIY